MSTSLTEINSLPQISLGDLESPRWLSEPDPSLPLDQERVDKLVAYLRSTGAGAAQAQVLYGREIGRGLIEWDSEPLHPDVPEPIDGGAGYVVRKISEGTKSPWKVHSIVIQSSYIMKILRKVLIDYPGVSPALDKLTLESPFKPMLHRWGDFCQAIESSDKITQNHIAGFVKILKTELNPCFRVLQDADKHQVIDLEHLWVIFPPGELVWWDLKQNHCVGRVLETWYDLCTGEFCIRYEQLVWDGFALKPQAKDMNIPPFTGTRPIPELNVVPLTRKPNHDQIRDIVLDRGSKFLGLCGCHYKQYLGLGETKQDRYGAPRWEAVNGRVVLDASLWDGKVADRQPTSLPISSDDDERIICSPLMKGYSLYTKTWYKLLVSNVSDIIWGDSFSHLVLGEVEKRLLLGFTKTKLKQVTSFDDFVQGKGKGVIILLAGPPGVGKTLTVESIAERMRAPLYPLSAGELGISPGKVESRLRQALTFCKEWDGVLLLDEADVFLESRGVLDLERNELVSIFLRLLEYYDGMMFLTTNRIESMDPAFQSRIDLTLRYKDLTQDAKKKIWVDLVKNGADGKVVENVDYDQLASYNLNGRQIKNVVKLARMLATEEDVRLGGNHLLNIVKMSMPEETPV